MISPEITRLLSLPCASLIWNGNAFGHLVVPLIFPGSKPLLVRPAPIASKTTLHFCRPQPNHRHYLYSSKETLLMNELFNTIQLVSTTWILSWVCKWSLPYFPNYCLLCLSVINILIMKYIHLRATDLKLWGLRLPGGSLGSGLTLRSTDWGHKLLGV